MKYKPVEYPKLSKGTVEAIHGSPYRRTWLADSFKIPRRLVTLIKNCATVEEAIERHGH